jgi:hypothetical protein
MKTLYTGIKTLNKYPTVAQLKEAVSYGQGRLNAFRMQIHHLAETHLIKKLLPGITDAELDTMPGWLIRVDDHITTNGQFRAIEEAFMAKLAKDGEKFDGAQLRELLKLQYPGTKNDGIRHALDLWLKGKGI